MEMTPLQKEEARKDLIKPHLEVLNSLSKDGNKVYCRVKNIYPNYPNAVGVFPNELSKGDDMYFILANPDYKPLDAKNETIYRLRHNPHYQDEYTLSFKGDYYMVPIDELEKVGLTDKSIKAANKSVMEDLPFSGASIRDVYAILHNKPVSTKDWINSMITAK